MAERLSSTAASSTLLAIALALLLPSMASGQTACIPTSTELCLNDGRFRVEVQWEDFAGNTGQGRAVLFGSDDSALLWFFNDQNWEMMVKVLNGCPVNDHFWVFSAATTNVKYTLTVTDTLDGARREYRNPLGRRAEAVTDTTAFHTCGSSDRRAQAPPSSPSAYAPAAASDSGGPCQPGPTNHCLNAERFRVEVDWRDFEGKAGSGKVVPVSSDDSGLFWFFNDQNWEMMVKVLDACDLNDRFWVFSAATTNVEYTLRVTDTVSGTTRTYSNPAGRAAPAITDTDAFATCEAEPSTPPTVRFVSDSSVILSPQHREARLEVEVVDHQGNPIPDASVSFASDAPQLFPVTAESDLSAVVRAVGQPPDHATVTARYGTSSARATVVHTKPGPDTVLIDSGSILGRSATEVLLERSPAHDALVPGQVIVSGDRGGLLDRISAVSLQTDAVRLTTVPTDLPTAFEEFHVEAEGEEIDARLRLGEHGDTLTLRDGDGRLLARTVIQGITCKTQDGTTAGVQVRGGNVEIGFRLRPRVTVDVSFFSLELFRAQLSGSLTLAGNTGSVTFSTDVAGTAECSVELSTLTLPAIPASVFSFGFKFVPSVGVEASAVFDGPSLTLTGPHGSAEGTATAGIQYTASGGWSSFSDRGWNGEFVPFATDLDLDLEFRASAGPFVKLEVGVDVDLGRGIFSLNLADFRFAELKGSGVFQLEMKSPLRPREPAYIGPRWELGLRAKGDLKAELAGGALVDLLNRLGIDTRYDGKLNLFDLEVPLLSSPAPGFIDALTPDDSCVGLPVVRSDRGESATFRVSGDEANGGLQVWASEGGAPPLGVITTGPYAMQNGHATWTPAPGTSGRFLAFPRLAVDAISRIAPYGAGASVFTEVDVAAGDGVPVIDSVEPQEAEVGNGGSENVVITFHDSDAGVDRVRFEIVERDCPEGCGIESTDFDPGVLKQHEGDIDFDARCINNSDSVHRVVFDITLSDCQGNVSEPVRWTFLCTTEDGTVETPRGGSAAVVTVESPRSLPAP